MNGYPHVASSTSKDPLPISRIYKGRKYELEVIQQPRRARMCGFGDKDRRPITAPPCVRLRITDSRTGREIDCNEVEHSMFVLNVDLWSSDAKREVNLVRHTTHNPTVSGSSTHSYNEARPLYTPIQPQQQFKNEPGQAPYPHIPRDGPPQVSPYGQRPGPEYSIYYNPGFGPNDLSGPILNGAAAGEREQQGRYPGAMTGAQIHAQGRADAYPPQHGYPVQGDHHLQSQQQGQQGEQLTQNPRPPQSQQPQGMFTRNLIGSLAASAFRLTDTNDQIGIWFVLQDLSVRTEGHFRLRFSFVNVGNAMTPEQMPPGNHAASNGITSANVNTGRAPILAACFSEAFTVYSAKKFPGVVESTPLSKCFATQGIKIPIRKDGTGGEKVNRKDSPTEYDDED